MLPQRFKRSETTASASRGSIGLRKVVAAAGLASIASIATAIVPGVVAPAPAHAAPVYYGAIAISGDGSWGRALNYRSAAAARNAAWNECPKTDCKVVAVFGNGCGAVIKHTDYWGFGSTGASWYQGGTGPTPRAATADAQRRARGGTYVVGGCTIRN